MRAVTLYITEQQRRETRFWVWPRDAVGAQFLAPSDSFRMLNVQIYLQVPRERVADAVESRGCVSRVRQRYSLNAMKKRGW